MSRSAYGPLSLALVAIAALSTTASAIASDRWTVTDLEGHVKVSRAGHWHTLEPGMDVAVGAWVKTGTHGRVTLERQGTSIEVKPRTQIAVAGRSLSPDKTVLMQRWGATSLDVDKRDEPHLEVHTPFLAAVVKGTELDVEVGRTRSDIGVRTGSVSVRDDARGMSAELGRGQSAGAGQGSGGAMRVTGARGAPKPTMRRTATAPVLMAPIARSAPVTSETVDAAPRTLLANARLRGVAAAPVAARRALGTGRAERSGGDGSLPNPPVAVTALRRTIAPAPSAGNWGGLLPPGEATAPVAEDVASGPVVPGVPAATPPQVPNAPATPADRGGSGVVVGAGNSEGPDDGPASGDDDDANRRSPGDDDRDDDDRDDDDDEDDDRDDD